MNNESMNNTNFKFSLVSSLVIKQIKAAPCLPKEVIHQLVLIFMNNTERNLCAGCDFFLRKIENDTSEKIRNVTCPYVVLEIPVVQERARITLLWPTIH